MRYRFIDEVRSLDLGAVSRAEVVKTFPPESDAFTGPAGPTRVPHSLVLELLAMTGGYLIFRHQGAACLPLLVKVPECRFEGVARPGHALRAVCELGGVSTVSHSASMAEARGEVFDGNDRVAAGRLLYLCVTLPGVDLQAFAGTA